MTLDCVGLTQSSVIQVIHCNVSLKFFFHLNFSLSLVFTYIYISQGSVETHLWFGGIHNYRHIIANCPQSVLVKDWSIIGKDMDKIKVPYFFMDYGVLLRCW